MPFEKCPHCSSRMEKQNAKGKLFPWKTNRDIPLPGDLLLWTCTNPLCREMMISGEEITLLDRLLESACK